MSFMLHQFDEVSKASGANAAPPHGDPVWGRNSLLFEVGLVRELS